MKKEDIAVLGLSAIAVLLILRAGGVKLPGLGMTAARSSEPFTVYNPFKSQPGGAYDPANPGALGTTSGLVRGTIAEYYSGDNSGMYTPTIAQTIDSVLQETYGLAEPTSIVRRDGAYW